MNFNTTARPSEDLLGYNNAVMDSVRQGTAPAYELDMLRVRAMEDVYNTAQKLRGNMEPVPGWLAFELGVVLGTVDAIDAALRGHVERNS